MRLAPPVLLLKERTRMGKEIKVTALDLSSGDFNLDIVGESYYQDELRRIAAGRTERRERVEFRAVLLPEPDSEYDPRAVAVHAERGGVIGHLSREDAALYQPMIVALQKTRSRYPACRAILKGGYGEKRYIGVVLDLDVDALLRESLTDPFDQLQKLADLHRAGLITDEEFAAKKADVLSRI